MKFKSLIYTALASALLFTSCDLNHQPVFDDDTQAFIGFSGTKATESIPEAKDGVVSTYALSLECASIKGITAQVAFAAVDTNYDASKRAQEGTDYVFKTLETYTVDAQGNRLNVETIDLTTGAEKIVKFDANHRFATIYIETIDNNIEDGDKKFDVVLSDVKGCNLGAKKSFAITIADDENPLNQLLGVYDATTPSAFDGYPDENWEVTIVADDETEGKIWIQPIITIGGLSAADIAPVHATVDLVQETIQMPYGQTVYGGEGQSYNMVIAGLENNPVLSGVAVATYDLSNGVVITFQNGYGVGNLAANEWWYNAYQGPVFTKQ